MAGASCSNCSATTEAHKQKYHWLPLIMIGYLFLMGIGSVFTLPRTWLMAASPSNALEFLLVPTILFNEAIGLWSGWVAIQLFRRTPGCLKQARYMLLCGFVGVVLDFIASVLLVEGETLPGILWTALCWTVVYFYFKKSTVVRRIYGTSL